MNSNPNNSAALDDEGSTGDSSDGSSTSTSSSRAERIRRERTQRHRQRLQRAKQFHQNSQQQQQQQSAQQQQQQSQQQPPQQKQPQQRQHSSQQRSQQQQPTHVRTSSSDSSGSSVASSTRGRGDDLRGRAAVSSSASGSSSNSNAAAPSAAAPPQQQQQQQHRPQRKKPNPQHHPHYKHRQQKQSENTQSTSQSQPQQRKIEPLRSPRSSPRSSPRPSSSSKSKSRSSEQSNNPPPPPPKIPSQTAPPQQQHPQPPSQPPPQQQQKSHHAPSSLHHKSGPVLVSVESPLPPLVQRSLGDRSYDKRKNAALEIEQLVKSLSEAHNVPMIQSIISVLAKDFCTSMNANYRKGGLIGIAATAIGLMGNTRSHLEGLLFPVLHCFDDPESRVRYYACESLYNIAKVARGSILRYFNQIFDGLTKLFADVDVDVKNGANLLDRLVKDIVTESESFHVEHFLPLLTTYIRRTNPYIRQLLVGWITVLDSVPDISMIDYLPDFLDGLFNMLSDSNREIRQAADSALSDFLKEVRHATVIEFGPLVSILVNQCLSKDRLNRLTAITWIEELIHHPYSGGDALLPHHAEVLGAILFCISDSEEQICLVAERTNADLLSLVRDTRGDFRLAPLLETLTEKFMTKDDVPTKMASLRWINMLLEKRRGDMTEFVMQLLPVLLKTLSDASDAVVLFTLQVLARISLGDGGGPLDEESITATISTSSGVETNNGGDSKDKHDSIHCGLLRGKKDEKHFKLVINAILGLFASDRMLLENRGSLVVRKFCVLLDAESVYMLMAEVLSSSCEMLPGSANPAAVAKEDPLTLTENMEKTGLSSNSAAATADNGGDQIQQQQEEDEPTTVKFTVEFVSTMVQTLNLILLTANELHGLRVLLANTFRLKDHDFNMKITTNSPGDEHNGTRNSEQVYESLFRCWCHSPVATFSLCLLARAYGVAFALVQKFSELEVTVGFLMQIDKLVQLLESPVFVHLRLQLLDVESPHHAPLLKSCYGLLMLLPQSDAFRSLNDRLTTVCNLRDNLGIPPTLSAAQKKSRLGLLSRRQGDLLVHFDKIMDLHRKMRGREVQQLIAGELLHDSTNRGRTSSSASVSAKGASRVGASGVGGGSGMGVSSNGNASPSVFYAGGEHHHHGGGVSAAGASSATNSRGRITQEV